MALNHLEDSFFGFASQTADTTLLHVVSDQGESLFRLLYSMLFFE